MADRVRASRPRRWLGRLLLILAALLLAGTGTLAWQTYTITRQLDDRVRVTQDLADGNVRTLEPGAARAAPSGEPPGAAAAQSSADVRLQRALAAQRVQEGALGYQSKTLGQPRSARQQARALQRQWDADVDPTVLAGGPGTARQHAASGRTGPASPTSSSATTSSSPPARTRARPAPRSRTRPSATSWSGARSLLVALVLTTVLMLAYAGFTIWGVRRLDRQRAEAAAALVASNRDLQRHAFVVRSTDNMVVLTDATRPGRVGQRLLREAPPGGRWTPSRARRPGKLLQGPGTDPETVKFMSRRLRAGEAFHAELLQLHPGRPARSGSLWRSTRCATSAVGLTGFVALADRRHRTTPRRAAPARGQGRRGGLGAREGRLPRLDEPRDPDPAQRGARSHRSPAAHRPGRRAARLSRDVAEQRPDAAGAGQRHPRLLSTGGRPRGDRVPHVRSGPPGP